MPERYSLCASRDALESRLQVEITDSYQPRFNAAPGQLLPVITNDSPKGFSFFYWGIDPRWSRNKNISRKLINADREVLLEKPSYRKALISRRCLVPADGFYGWKSISKKSKVPYRIILNQEEVFCMAGLWEEYENEAGEEVHTFSIITTTANSLVDAISDRMPAILSPTAEKTWLQTDISSEDLLDLLQPYPADNMGQYTVSPMINSTKTDMATMVQPVPPVDQYGNYTLFN